MWQSIDKLLGQGRLQSSDDISACDFHSLFDKKVANIRASTCIAACIAGVHIHRLRVLGFSSCLSRRVVAAVRAMPNKQSASDPIPTWLLKECTSELAPFFCRLFNAYLLAGVVPAAFKSAYICPLIKKPDLDRTDVKNYRPISNLTVLSKLSEKLVARQLIDYLSDNN